MLATSAAAPTRPSARGGNRARDGWAGRANGELLRLAAGRFDVFITVYTSLAFQQNLRDAPLGVVLLAAPSNRLEALLPLMPILLGRLDGLKPGDLLRLEHP